MTEGVTVTHAVAGRHVVAQCGACPNRAVLQTTTLAVPLATVAPRAGANLNGTDCAHLPRQQPGGAKGRTR